MSFSKKEYLYYLLIVLFLIRAFFVSDYLTYLTLLLLAIILLLNYNNLYKLLSAKNIFVTLIAFTLWTALTAIWSVYKLYSIERAVYLGLLVISIYSIALHFSKNKSSLLNFIYKLGAAVITISLISFIFDLPANSWSGGNGKGFMGLAVHQNTLGSILLIFLAVFNIKLFERLISTNYKFNLNFLYKNIFNVLLNICGFIFLIITFSRASIISYLLFVSFFTIGIFGIKKFSITLLVFALLILTSTQISPVKKFYRYMLYKGDSSIISTRGMLFSASIEGAKSGGLFGLGFGMSDQKIIVPHTGSRIENEMYIREKGNSTLALIEETGIIGLILFYFPLAMTLTILNSKLKLLSKEKLKSDYIKLLFFFSMMVSLLIHSQFEAWLLGVGSVQLPIFLIIYFVSLIYINREESF